jgi:UPF0716 protein FxsA
MPVLVLLLILVPLAELWVIVQTADVIGVLPTILLLLAVSILGAWLLKREGVATWRKLRSTMARGELPANEVVDGALILLGGALLLTPGFLTDVVGLMLVFPATRAGTRRFVRPLLRWKAFKRFGFKSEAARRVYETRARRVRSSRGAASSEPSRPSQLSPGSGRPGDEVDSRDTG